MIKRLVMVLMCCFGLALAAPAYVDALEVNMHVEWTYNGSETLEVEGFKLYRLVEGDASMLDKTLVATIVGETTRTWDGEIYALTGVNRYVLTAYGTGGESPQSPGYRFEYQDVEVNWETEVPGIFILRLNNIGGM